MFWNNLTFRRKLVVIIILTCGISLAVACAIFFVYETKSYKSNMLSNLSSLANVIKANTVAALVFEDNAGPADFVSSTKWHDLHRALIDL